jgi:hypothetical protein
MIPTYAVGWGQPSVLLPWPQTSGARAVPDARTEQVDVGHGDISLPLQALVSAVSGRSFLLFEYRPARRSLP